MNRQIFKLIRAVSRNGIVRKAMPYMLQEKLWDLVLKNKGKKLRNHILKYFEDKTTNNTKIQKAINFLKNNQNGLASCDFLKIWLDSGAAETCFDFNGAKLPDITGDTEKMKSLSQIFQDVFLFLCFFDDDYNKSIVEDLDPFMMEGPYGYRDGDFDVTVKEHDAVIDAGAWIGDFSAYAASKGAAVYAFEPVAGNYALLEKTAVLNTAPAVHCNMDENRNFFLKIGGGGGVIFPIQKGLGSQECRLKIFINKKDSSGSGMYLARSKIFEEIDITTLDKFVTENHMNKLDFIKADIEGGERDLLRGAANVLKRFAPKLAICTYHSLKDPELLEKIILEANPKYTVIHTRQKLFAWQKKD